MFGAYEACCFQTRDLFDAIAKEEGSIKLKSLRVDGGMTKSSIMLQRQSDLLQVPVERPEMSETTALGAALAAAVGCGLIQPHQIRYVTALLYNKKYNAFSIIVAIMNSLMRSLIYIYMRRRRLKLFCSNMSAVERFEPNLSSEEVGHRVALWNKAVEKSFDSV